jgi:hypothetical protein
MRAILIRHRTAMINQMRGLLGERGLTISRSPEAFKRAIPELLSKRADELTSFCQTLLTELLEHLHAIEERVHLIEASIQSFIKQSVLCKKIAQVPGIGPIEAAGMLRQGPTRQAGYMHADRFDITNKKLAKGVGSIHVRKVRLPSLRLSDRSAIVSSASKETRHGPLLKGRLPDHPEHRFFP